MLGRPKAIIVGFGRKPPSLVICNRHRRTSPKAGQREVSEPKPCLIARGTGSSKPSPSSMGSAANLLPFIRLRRSVARDHPIPKPGACAHPGFLNCGARPGRSGSFRPRLRCMGLSPIRAQQNPSHSAGGDGPNSGRADSVRPDNRASDDHHGGDADRLGDDVIRPSR
jgi:hypothetical protein